MNEIRDAPITYEDEEMNEYLAMENVPISKTAYRSEDDVFDFKNQRARRSFCLTQCIVIFLRKFQEHWNNKARFLALAVLPGLFVFLSWHCTRYF